MSRLDRRILTPSLRMTLPALAAIAVLIGYAAVGPLPVRDGTPRATADQTALWDSAIPNLTAVKASIVAYHDSGAWAADTYHAVRPAQDYFLDQLDEGGRPAMVFDIDDTLLSNYDTLHANDFGRVIPELVMAIDRADFAPIEATLDLYRLAVANDVAVFLITGRAERLREATARNLAAAGITEYDGLIMQPDDAQPTPSVIPFKSGARQRIAEEGYRILVNVGDQDSDLAGGFAERTYKVPNPMYIIP
jgi:predicted secreted acid phosphatase